MSSPDRRFSLPCALNRERNRHSRKDIQGLSKVRSVWITVSRNSRGIHWRGTYHPRYVVITVLGALREMQSRKRTRSGTSERVRAEFSGRNKRRIFWNHTSSTIRRLRLHSSAVPSCRGLGSGKGREGLHLNPLLPSLRSGPGPNASSHTARAYQNIHSLDIFPILAFEPLVLREELNSGYALTSRRLL